MAYPTLTYSVEGDPDHDDYIDSPEGAFASRTGGNPDSVNWAQVAWVGKHKTSAGVDAVADMFGDLLNEALGAFQIPPKAREMLADPQINGFAVKTAVDSRDRPWETSLFPSQEYDYIEGAKLMFMLLMGTAALTALTGYAPKAVGPLLRAKNSMATSSYRAEVLKKLEQQAPDHATVFTHLKKLPTKPDTTGIKHYHTKLAEALFRDDRGDLSSLVNHGRRETGANRIR